MGESLSPKHIQHYFRSSPWFKFQVQSMGNQKVFLNSPEHHIPDLNCMVTVVSQELFTFQAEQWNILDYKLPRSWNLLFIASHACPSVSSFLIFLSFCCLKLVTSTVNPSCWIFRGQRLDATPRRGRPEFFITWEFLMIQHSTFVTRMLFHLCFPPLPKGFIKDL